MQTSIRFLTVYFFVISVMMNMASLAETISSEILDIRANQDLLLIDVAKRYPDIKFFAIQNPNKILIELLDTKYHQKFVFNELTKETFLNELLFVDDISFDVVKYDNDKQKIVISLPLKETQNLTPRIQSTKDNIVKISFVSDKKNEQTLPNTSELFNTAVDEHANGNFDKAENLYNQILTYKKDFYLAQFNLAQIYINKHDYDKAVSLLFSLLDNLQKLPPESLDKKILITVQNTLGTVYYLIGSIEKAYNLFNHVVKLDPNYYQGYYNLGLIYEKIKDINEAKSAFRKVVELKPDFSDAYYHLAVLNLITKDKKDAISKFKKVIELSNGTKVAELSKTELEKLEKKRFKLFK